MLNCESPEAWALVSEAVSNYEKYFNLIFPFYEYVYLAADNGFDISNKGAKKFVKFIDTRIKQDNPVEIPEGYTDRIY